MYIKIYAKLRLYFLIIHYYTGSGCLQRFIAGKYHTDIHSR